jgi:gamma-glutamylcyclotransferase (GGCT)/AIG2-like uncharacterized protein YtfP
MNFLKWIFGRREEGIKHREVRKILEEAKADAKFSPDMSDLEDYEKVSLFVHDNLKNDAERLAEATHVGTAFTKGEFAFWKRTCDDKVHAVALSTHCGNKMARSIRGELYRVSPDLIFELDKLYENGVAFNRTRLSIIMLGTERTWTRPHPANGYKGKVEEVPATKKLRAYMYLGNPDFWKPQLDSAVVSMSNGHGRTKIKVSRGQTFDNGYFEPVTVCHPNRVGLPDYYNFHYDGE